MVLLLYGNEPYCISNYIQKQKEKLENLDLNYLKAEIFDEREYELAYQYPLLEEKRLIHLALDKFEMSAYLEKYLNSPCEHTDLLITCVSGVDKRTTFYKKLQKNKMLKEINKVDEETLKKFILFRIRNNASQITEDAYRLLLQHLRYHEDENCNLYTVEAAVTKLCLLDEPITVDFVNSYVEKSIDDNIFALASLLANKDTQALDLLNVLIENKEDAIYILSLILRSFRMSYKAYLFDAKSIGVPSYQVHLHTGLERNHLVKAIEMVTEAISKIKLGYPGECLLRQTVSKILL